MARPLRVEFAGAVHHVMARGNVRERIFRSDDDHTAFPAGLARTCERFGLHYATVSRIARQGEMLQDKT